MSRVLPGRPNLQHLRKQAKTLLRDYLAGEPAAVDQFPTRKGTSPAPKLADAQHVLARQYGFATWTMLKHEVESLTGTDPAAALDAAVRLDDAARVRAVLSRFPSLAARLDDALPNRPFGATPLIAAVHQRNRAMVEMLLDAGANVNQRTHWWAGGFGVLGDDAELNSYLISRGAAVDAYDAARLGMLDRLAELLTVNPSLVHARFGDGQTPLHVAASVDIAKLLLDRGADIDATDVDHESTPAQYLVGEHPDVVRFLISRGCRTDILMASAAGDAELVRKHLDRDPDTIRTCVSPRFFPMSNPRAGGTIYIWSLGKYRTAHSIARERGYADVLHILDDNTPPLLALELACEAGDGAKVRQLQQAGAAVALGETAGVAIVHAAELNNGASAALMLSAGWSAKMHDQSGTTALHWAAFHGNAALAAELIRRGAEVNARESKFDGSPLDWMKHGSESSWFRDAGNYPGVLDTLISAGAA
jgi:ankyrin repeat protein